MLTPARIAAAIGVRLPKRALMRVFYDFIPAADSPAAGFSGGIDGAISSLGRMLGSIRKTAGYLSGSRFASGSVERHV